MIPNKHLKALRFLISLGEPGRKQRAALRPLLADPGYHQGRLTGVCGMDRQYFPSITLDGKRGFNCTCPDLRSRGHLIGPCKHVISLAQRTVALMGGTAAPF